MEVDGYVGPEPYYYVPVEDKKFMKTIVDFFLKHKDSGPFREAVDWEALGLDDYPLVISNPMDLATVERKVARNNIYPMSDFATDMRLIWANCQKYNEDESDFYNLAGTFEKLFEQHFQDAQWAAKPAADTSARNKNVSPSLRKPLERISVNNKRSTQGKGTAKLLVRKTKLVVFVETIIVSLPSGFAALVSSSLLFLPYLLFPFFFLFCSY
jgi:hypothetical protein